VLKATLHSILFASWPIVRLAAMMRTSATSSSGSELEAHVHVDPRQPRKNPFME
jgi:hypothetical protein